MIAIVALTIAITCALSTLIILSLAMTAPAEPQPKLPPFTQAIIDEIRK